MLQTGFILKVFLRFNIQEQIDSIIHVFMQHKPILEGMTESEMMNNAELQEKIKDTIFKAFDREKSEATREIIKRAIRADTYERPSQSHATHHKDDSS